MRDMIDDIDTSEADDARPPDGLIETADPATGTPEMLAFWLPAAVTAAALGLERVLTKEEIGNDLAT